MYETVTKLLEEIDHWRDNSSTEDTLDSLTSVETLITKIQEMNHAILKEEEDAATEFPSILKLLIKKINITGNNPLTRQWWYDVMTSRPPPLPKKEENIREIILDLVEEGWIEGDWTKTMPRLLNDLLQEKFISASKMTPTRVACINEGVQWIRMEELGKALTNRCRAVRELPHKKQKNLTGTRDRNFHGEQLEFDCQLRTPTRSRIYELLELGTSSSLNLFQSLITNQDLVRLREDMWPNHKTLRKGWWCRASATAINRQCPTCNRLWTT